MIITTHHADGKTKETFKINSEDVYCNNVVLQGEHNPHKVCLFLVGEFHSNQPLFALWADSLQDALDESADMGLLDAFAWPNATEEDNPELLGNASEPFNLQYLWYRQISPSDFPIALTIAFAEARGANADTLKLHA